MIATGAWRKSGLFVVGVILILAVPALPDAPAPRGPADLGTFTKEIMSLKLEGAAVQLAMWFPMEFFAEAALAEGGATREQVEKNLAFMKPFHTLVVQVGTSQPDGATTYESERSVRARAVLRAADGDEVGSLEKPPPMVSATVNAMKGFMAQDGNTANMHVLVFPASTPGGKPLVDVAKRGKLTLVLKAKGDAKESQFIWRTPFDALNPVPPCAKCKEPVSGKWFFCPWCGAKLAG